jgi:glycosyltransferase involved in cell wall biosynthesis
MAADLANRIGRPLMFEVIGDPEATFREAVPGALGALLAARETRRLRRLVRRAVSGSYVSRVHLQRKYPSGPGARVESVSSIRLDRTDLRAARVFDAPPTPLRIVLVASLIPAKRHEVLLQAAARAVAAGRELTLSLVGDGPRRAELMRLADALGLERAVRFHGHVADPGMIRDLLDQSDLFVMSSASEGLPRALIEAMARGLPAVGSRIGGIDELLPDQQMFPSGDVEALAQLLLQAGSDVEFLNRAAAHSASVAGLYVQPVLAARRQRVLEALRGAAAGVRHG